MRRLPCRLAAALSLACVSLGTARAADPYVAIGLPGIVVGVAQPLHERFTIRADYATLGSRDFDGNHEGIDYRGDARFNRVGLFGDWFISGGFRLTIGATFNDGRMDLTALGDGTPITIGDTTYATTAADRFDAKVRFPDVTPYLGIGFGHHSEQVKGLSFLFDLGASIGQAKVTTSTQGPLLGQVSQEDLDAETEQLREGVGKVKAIPQLTLGLAYRF